MKINGWTILFHPLFNDQWQQLLNLVKSLRSRLSQEDFIRHPQVKLFKALTVGIEEKIPNDPLASYFTLRKPLDKYSRLKKMGLPNRYRLFFGSNRKKLVWYMAIAKIKTKIKKLKFKDVLALKKVARV